MGIGALYPCDPEKNTACTKESCQTLCKMTTDPTCAKEGWKFTDLQIVKDGTEITMADVLFIKMLEAEGKSNESGN